MTKFLTEETPAKVMSLLGVAMASMMFLLVATQYNVSFEGTQSHVPDPVGPASVVAFIDGVASSYSGALHSYVIDSGAKDFAMAGQNISWVASNAKDGALALVGHNPGDGSQPVQLALRSQPRVAGAYTAVPSQAPSGLVDKLLAALGVE